MFKYDGTYWDDVEKVIRYVPHVSELFHKSILITGATGMICSAVVDLLFHLNRTSEAGIRIFLAGRSQGRMEKRFYPFSEGTDYFFLQYDATKDKELGFSADYIIHGASNSSPEMYRIQPVETMLSNLIGLNCLLNMAMHNDTKRLLYISSSEVYGQKQNNCPFNESDYGYVDILNLRAAYPSSKRAGETLCIAYGEEYGVDTVIVRPGHIYGPTMTDSDDRAVAQFTRNALRGEPIVMKSSGNQLRSYCYTLDCASAILTVLINGEKGKAYNISNKDSVVSICDVAEALAHKAETSIEFCNPSDTEKKGYNLMVNSVLIAEELEALGWQPQFDLQTGIARTVDVMRKRIEG